MDVFDVVNKDRSGGVTMPSTITACANQELCSRVNDCKIVLRWVAIETDWNLRICDI